MSGGGVADQRGWLIGVVCAYWRDDNLSDAPGLIQLAPSIMIRHVLEERFKAQILDPSP